MEETLPEQIVGQIAVPGGTIEQGLKALEDGKLEYVLKDAFDRTIKRAEEIGKKEQSINKDLICQKSSLCFYYIFLLYQI